MLLLFLFNVATLWLLLLNTTIVPCSLFDIAALVSNWYSPSSFFANVGRAVQIEVLHAKLGR